MAAYWLGLATLPALAIAGMVVVFAGSRVAAAMVSAADFTIHRIKPDAPMTQRRSRAAAIYGAPRGFVIAKGRFGLVLISDLDPEARAWAHARLADGLTYDQITPLGVVADDA